MDYEGALRRYLRAEQRSPARPFSSPLTASALRRIAATPSRELTAFYKLPAGTRLAAHQARALRHCLLGWGAGRNTLLALESGLGRTAVVCALLQAIRRYISAAAGAPFLVLVEEGRVARVAEMIRAWTDIECVCYDGGAADRKVCREHEFLYAKEIAAGVARVDEDKDRLGPRCFVTRHFKPECECHINITTMHTKHSITILLTPSTYKPNPNTPPKKRTAPQAS